MDEDLKNRLSTLTPRERKYFLSMYPHSGVVYISSKPGIGKSAITRAIAEKMGYDYYDIRLSMVDETDVGLYPTIDTIEYNGKPMKCLDFIVPKWALKSNERKTIIHFEELNRAPIQVRNAALQILLERSIGIEFKFNDDVLMIASGNLGEEDSTDVEEFDSALNNRLIHFDHSLSAQEWISEYANKNIHPMIVQYIENYPDYLYKFDNNSKAYASHRSWTFLSNLIVKIYGMDSSPSEFIEHLSDVAAGYIGNSSTRFIQYCYSMINININDIINRFDEIESELKKHNRDKNSELIHALKTVDITSLSDFQIDNIGKFLKRVGDDEVTAYLIDTFDSEENDTEHPNYRRLLLPFIDLLREINNIGDEME